MNHEPTPTGEPGPTEQERLRELLAHAVDDVEPRGGLDAIRHRTEEKHMSARPWYLGAGAAVVATAATILAVTVIGDDPGTSPPAPAASSPAAQSSAAGPEPSATSADPSAAPSPSTSGQPSGAQVAAPVYYVGDTGRGPRLYREFHGVPKGPTINVAAEAVTDAVTDSADDPDYRTAWPAGTAVQHVELSGGTIIVDLVDAPALHDRPAGMSQEQARMALQQVIYTVQGVYQDRAPVRFLLDGRPSDTVLGEPTAEPLAQGDPTSVLAQVWITAPADGATVPSGFTVEGLGAFFEANVVWELLDGPGGAVVRSGTTMAQECCRMAPYSFTVDAPPGDYVLVVRDEDPSGGEGPEPFQDTKQVTVTD